MTEPITVRVDIRTELQGVDMAWRSFAVKLGKDAESDAKLLKMLGQTVSFALGHVTAERGPSSNLSNDLGPPRDDLL